jgi:hypothetical protein
MGEGAAGLLAFFQEIKRELPFFLYLLSCPNKRVRKVDSDDMRDLAGELEGASTDCATKVKSSKRLIFYVRKEELCASGWEVGYAKRRGNSMGKEVLGLEIVESEVFR